MRYTLKISIVIILSILFISSCINSCFKYWKFELPFNIINQENTYIIGDTIWIVSEFSNTLQDLNTPSVVSVEDFDFNISLNIEEIHGTPISWGSDKFLVVKEVGELSFFALPSSPDIGGNPGYFKLKHNYNAGQYSFKYGFVPQEEGVFLFSLNSSFRTAYDKIDFGSGCNEEIDRILFNMNNKLNNNFELLSLSPDLRISELSSDNFYNYGMFSFTVVPR